ncbi:MAG: flavodoxin-dependent (E)-4-hydroxy-3-methylbut-2-enyl-diphosphate synthase [bacterium]|jgi:(E)-4-hydroxy-3-methylbut-2-enyl-diphosphate synthase|nr:flavodoxin-dependent (E)-4-hydroxy-3-methylbut-2-enyl-diphosphate synthase [bacterium]
MIVRRDAKRIALGTRYIGGNGPVMVQSMANTDTRNVKETAEQIARLRDLGCEAIRVAVPDMEAAHALGKIKATAGMPLIADIHFDYRLALEALKQGVDKLRLNPGNISDAGKVKEIACEAKARGVPIRVGANAGSLSPDIVERYGGAVSEAIVESAWEQVRLLEENGFEDIVISLKAFDIEKTVDAYARMAERTDYPFHIGITEAGRVWAGTIRSSIGIGILLYKGLGDTLRVSLTAEPEEEVKTAWEILKSLGIRQRGPIIISCPTCGRCEVDVIGMAQEVENRLSGVAEPIKIAVMGCVVNGPGEARDADVGIAGGRGRGMLFRHGKMLKVLPERLLIPALMAEIDDILLNREAGGTKNAHE